MPSLFKRIASRSAGQAGTESGPAPERIDPSVLLPQVRAGLSALEEETAQLTGREQELLVEASALYEHLKLVATALADVRQQRAMSSDKAAKFQAAIVMLEQQQTGAISVDHIEPTRKEALVAQPKM